MSHPSHGPNCWHCQFFALSYDARMPYICKRYGFRTQVMPAIEVLRADGQFCMAFLSKPETAQKRSVNSHSSPVVKQPPRDKPNAGFGVETWV